MAALQDYNDLHETTYELIVARLRTMPVWRGSRQSAAEPADKARFA
jgi:hypothetical protein